MVSIILPVYNEEKSIGHVIDDIRLVMTRSGVNFEIIVVDDGSTDQTFCIAKSKDVKIYRYAVNKGLGAAKKTGILNAQGDTIVTLDADGSYSADSIPEMLSFIPKYDQVIGVRANEYGSLKFIRLLGKKFIFYLASILAKQKIPDLNSGLRIIKREIIMRYLHLLPDGFSCDSTMTLVFVYNGYAIKYIPIKYHKRIGKSKFNIFRDTLYMILVIIRMRLKFKKSKCFNLRMSKI